MTAKLSAPEIVTLEERLRHAMLTSDVAALDALIAPDLIFTSHLGHLISKQQDLDLHRSGVFKLTALTPSEQRIQHHSSCSVVSVKIHLLGTYQENPVDQHIRYTRVWAETSPGNLQIVAGHASVVATEELP